MLNTYKLPGIINIQNIAFHIEVLKCGISFKKDSKEPLPCLCKRKHNNQQNSKQIPTPVTQKKKQKTFFMHTPHTVAQG
ncbi:uncharacterized protein LOC136095376 isoform X2 [Hydra vulgaris]|uniref:uncharacterized protein LOC136095376 isoform X2 n=1 Tax=Hydra vulgaris TaxID=6087 RepID=UPI0032E9DC5C